MDDPVSDELLEKALTAIEADDKSAFMALLSSELAGDQGIDEDLTHLFELYQGRMNDYEKIGRYLRWRTANGQSIDYVECTYKVTTEVDEYLITLLRSSGTADVGLYGFNLKNYKEYMASRPIGIFGEFTNWSARHWALLAYSIICYLFTLLALIHCIRHKMRKKWLFLILIFIQVGMTFTYAQDVDTMSFMVWVLGMSSLLIYPQVGQEFCLIVPLGMILYWFIPKKMPKPKHDDLVIEENGLMVDEVTAIDQPSQATPEVEEPPEAEEPQ